MEQILQSELNQVSMQIILYAGDARTFASDSLKAAQKFDFETANKLIIHAEENITKAHKAQTNVLQSATAGTEVKYSLLFAHAQDTLMTIISEINISKELINVLKIIKNNGTHE